MATSPRKLTEKAWQQQVIDLATVYGWRHYHTYDARRSDPGWPDLVLARPPELLFVELKSDGGRVSPAQEEWMETLRACGSHVALWRPRDFEEVHARLRAVLPPA